MFALILNNKVVDLSGQQFPISDNMEWVECASNVQIGYYFIDGKFTDDIRTPSEKKENLREDLIKIRKNFLTETDFKVLRFIDQGLPYPDEIKIKRNQARQEINDIEKATTLLQLQNFSNTF